MRALLFINTIWLGINCFNFTPPLRAEQKGHSWELFGSEWTRTSNVVVQSSTTNFEASQAIKTFQWKNNRGELEDLPCKLVYLEQKNIFLIGRDENPPPHVVFFNNQLISIEGYSLPGLWVHVSTNRLNVGESLKAKVDEAVRLYLKYIPRDPFSYYRVIGLRDVLGPDAFNPQHAPLFQPAPKITDIKVTDSSLSVTLVGRHGNIAVVTLDADLNPTLAFLDGKKVFPKRDSTKP